MLRRGFLLAFLLFLSCFAGCGKTPQPVPEPDAGPAAADVPEPVVLKVGCQSAENSSEILVVKRFEELVESASGGTLDVQIFPSSTLGSIHDLLSGVSLGTIEMATIGMNSYSASCGDFVVYDLWAFKGPEEFVQFYNSPVGQRLNQHLLEDAGIRVLSYNLCGTGRLYFWGNRPISATVDYQGLKIRTNSSATCAVAIAALGAYPVSVSWSDMSAALQTGVIDVGIGDVENMLTSGFYDYVAYRYDTSPNFMGSSLCISESVWEFLTPNQRAIIETAALQACQTYGDILYRQKVVENEAALETAGIQTLSMPQEEREMMLTQIETFLYEYLSSAISEELLKEVQDVWGNNF